MTWRREGLRWGSELHLKPLYFPQILLGAGEAWWQSVCGVNCGKGTQLWPPFCSRSPDPTVGPPRKWEHWSNQTWEANHTRQSAVLLTGAHGPLYLKKPEPPSLCTADGPHSRWPGTSLRDKWARWLGILEGLQGMGQAMPLEKYSQKLWRNTPPFMHEMHMGEKWILDNKYSWVFVKKLKIFSICTNIILAYYVCEILKVMFHSDFLCSLAKFQYALQCHCLCELASLHRKANLILFNLPFSGV